MEVCATMRQAFAFMLWWDDIRPMSDDMWPQPYFTNRAEVLRTACLESSLLSLRKLAEFFATGSSRHKDDIRATDFSGFEGRELLSREEMREIHKQLMHLTYHPVTKGTTQWDFNDVLSLAAARSLEFLTFLETSFKPRSPFDKEQIYATRLFLTQCSSRAQELAEEGPSEPPHRKLRKRLIAERKHYEIHGDDH